ncbi:MAG: hypothetical protein WDW38_002730 [Sanguina aurantia]
MVLLDNGPWLNELGKLYERNKASGTVWVTMKRSSMKNLCKKNTNKRGPCSERPQLAPPPTTNLVCLVRANDGKKHISTTVTMAQHAKFQLSVALIMKANMDALKKKEKNKPSKEQKAADPTQ